MVNRILIIVLEALLVAAVLTDELIDLDRSDRSSAENPEYPYNVEYNEYPMVVPEKKTAMLLDRMLIALKHVIDEEAEEAAARRVSFEGTPRIHVRQRDLQRRGQTREDKQRSFKCYFNPVTCF